MSDRSPTDVSHYAARALTVVVLVGVALRLWQWAGNASLWLDELLLVEGLLGRDVAGLLSEPLPNRQIAPPLFLVAMRAVAVTLGDSERMLRLLPLLASVGTLGLVTWIAPRIAGKLGAVVAVGLVALNPLLVSVGAIVKQYATDGLVSALSIAAALVLLRPAGGIARRLGTALGAGLLVFLSTPGVIVAAGGCAALVVAGLADRRSTRSSMKTFGGPVMIWGGVALAAAVVTTTRVNVETGSFMREYWSSAFAPSFLEYPTWILDLGLDLGLNLLATPYVGDAGLVTPFMASPWIQGAFLLLSAVGCLRWLLRGESPLLALIVVPCAATLVLSRLHVYPMEQRLLTFLVPVILLAFASGVEGLARTLERRSPTAMRAIPLMVLVPAVLEFAMDPPVWRIEEIRTVVRDLATHRAPGELVAFHGQARVVGPYYGRRFGVVPDLILPTDDLATQLRRLDAEAGQTVWILWAHTSPSAARDRLAVLCHLRTTGQETYRLAIETAWEGRPVSIHRFEVGPPHGRHMFAVPLEPGAWRSATIDRPCP